MLSYEAVARFNAESERPGNAQAEFRELVSFYQERLDRVLSDSEAFALFKVQVGLRRQQDAMAKRLDQGKLTMDEYLEQLSDAMRDAMSEYRDVLKPDEFYRAFGDAGADPDALLVQDRLSA